MREALEVPERLQAVKEWEIEVLSVLLLRESVLFVCDFQGRP